MSVIFCRAYWKENFRCARLPVLSVSEPVTVFFLHPFSSIMKLSENNIRYMSESCVLTGVQPKKKQEEEG